MMLVDLADVLRAAGLVVIERPGWRTRGHGDMGEVLAIVLHHTAGPAGSALDAPSLKVVEEGRPDLKGPLAHILLARSGTVHVVAAGLCWHTGKTREPWQANAYAVGIEAEHAGREQDPWPPAQLDAMVRLCRALCGRYGIPHARVLGHKEIASPPGRKIDPIGIDMRAFRAALSHEEETVPSAEEIAAAVWAHRLRNSFDDEVTVAQVINGVEQRVSDLQREVAELRVLINGQHQ